MAYEFKTKPFDHQFKEWEEHYRDEARAIFWEQGVGKSKLIIDTAGTLYEEGEIDALVVIAPEGVHRNWIVEEIPNHLPERILQEARCHTYRTAKSRTLRHLSEVEATLKHRGLAVLAITFDAVMTEDWKDGRGKRYPGGCTTLWKFLRDRKCLYVVDESARIKTPGAKRTRRVVSSGRYGKYRRILTGTPVPNSPFDVYSQMQFLDPSFWIRHGITTFEGFKTTFGVFVEQYIPGREKPYKVLTEYLGLDRLHRIIDDASTRLLKEDVLDLPPKLYSRARHELEPEQRRLYNELRDEWIAYIEQADEFVEAELAIVRLLRLQQVACGYLPTNSEREEPYVDLCKSNPRLNLLKEITQDLPHKAIIFCRFRRDIDLIMGMLGDEAVRYDGLVDDEACGQAIERFQRGDAKFFVANTQKAAEGLTLTAAKTVIYYSNSFNLGVRLQSEDRAHRIGQDQPVHYIDMSADDTVDARIISTLRKKLEIASQVTGDKVKEWL